MTITPRRNEWRVLGQVLWEVVKEVGVEFWVAIRMDWWVGVIIGKSAMWYW